MLSPLNLRMLRQVYIERRMREGVQRSKAIEELSMPLTEEEKIYCEEVEKKWARVTK